MRETPEVSQPRRAHTMNQERLTIVFGALFGILIGMGVFTLNYAEGLSYLSADPKACVNCHIMRPQHDSWQKSSHHTAAKCVDCHLPHSFIRKYMAKTENGYHHSKGFTLQDFHEPIMIKEKNSRILQENCLACHEDMVRELVGGGAWGPDSVSCAHCHRSVGHGDPVGMGGPDRGEALERQLQWSI